MQAAADWIIRQRTLYMKDIPNRQDLLVAGLMPPCMLGDYAMPSCDWHWYYCDNAFSLQGLQRFADALTEFDPEAAGSTATRPRRFATTSAGRWNGRRRWRRCGLGATARIHSFIPRMAYARGLTGPELGAPQFPDCDRSSGALPLAEPFAALDADDIRMVDT